MPRVDSDFKKKKKRFCCEKCGDEFQNNWDLNRHFDRIHLGIQYFCDKCGKGFDRAYRRNHHFLKCGQPQHFCESCCVDFKSAYELNVHKTAEHIMFKYACSVCDRPYASYQALRIHMRTCGIPCVPVTKSTKSTIKYKEVRGKLIKVEKTHTQSSSFETTAQDARVEITALDAVPFYKGADALLIAGPSLTTGNWQQTGSLISSKNTLLEDPRSTLLTSTDKSANVRMGLGNPTSSINPPDNINNVFSLDGDGSAPTATSLGDYNTTLDDIWGDSYPDLLLGVCGHQDENQLKPMENPEDLDDLERFMDNMLDGGLPSATTMQVLDATQSAPVDAIPSTSSDSSPFPPMSSTPKSPTMIDLPLLPLPGKPVGPDGKISQIPTLLWELLREVAVTNTMLTRAADLSTIERTLSSTIRRLRRANEDLLLANHCQINFV